MTLLEFAGCSLFAFGPPVTMFILTIAAHPIRVILLIIAAFFWLVSFLSSSIIWLILSPFSPPLIVGAVIAVLFQEAFRYLIFYFLNSMACALVAESRNIAGTGLENKRVLAYVSGLGFGMMSGAFAMSNIVADMVGPGTVGLQGESNYFFITSACFTLSLILLHIFWSIIFFNACETKRLDLLSYVVASHLFVSIVTFYFKEMYATSLSLTYANLTVTALLAYKIAGGTYANFKRSLSR